MRQERNVGADTIALQNSAKAAVSPSEDQIAIAAYQLWLERGCPHGSHQEDWSRAEAMLTSALVMKGEDMPRHPLTSCFDTLTPSEMRDEFALAIWQEGHWEVWEREWISARWVPDLRGSGVGVSKSSVFLR